MNNKGFAPPIILLTIILAFTVGFYLRYLTNKAKLPVPTTQENTSLNSNWKTCISSLPHFSIEYPPNWKCALEKDNRLYLSNFISRDSVPTTIVSISVQEIDASSLNHPIYKSVSQWYNALEQKNDLAVKPTPNDGFYYGPGSDNPLPLYMYYEAKNVKNQLLGKIQALVVPVAGSNFTDVLVLNDQKNILRLTITPSLGLNSSEVTKILSTLRFIN